MNSKDIYKIVHKVENRLDLQNLIVEGIHIWPYLRFNLVMRLNMEILENDPNKEKYINRIIQKLKLIPYNVVSLFVSFVKGMYTKYRKVDVVFLTDSSAKRLKKNDKWYDVFVDPLIEFYDGINEDTFSFETSQRFIFKDPSYESKHTIADKMVLLYIKSLLTNRRIKFDDTFLAEYKSYCTILKEEGKQYLLPSLMDIRMEFSYISELANYFEKRLKLLKPKIVFLVPYNGYSGKALISVCKKLSILTVDIQHGVQGYYHPAYSSFENIPSNSFNVLPDVFLTWTEDDNKKILEWANNTKSTKAFVLGNLFQQKFIYKTDLSLEHDKLYDTNFQYCEGKIVILLSLIWGNYFPQLFEEIIKRAPNNYYFLIRFHPSTSIDERESVTRILKCMNKSNFEFELASSIPIYSIMRNIHINLTSRSTTVIEAASFGIKSIITGNIGKSYYQDYINSGMAYYSYQSAEIISLIEQNCSPNYRQNRKNKNNLYTNRIKIILNQLDTMIN